MDVMFDSGIFTRQRYGGISRQFVEIAKHLAATDFSEIDVIAKFHFNQHLREFNLTRNVSFNRSIYISKFPNNLRRKIEAMNLAIEKKIATQIKPLIIHHTFYPSSKLTSNSRMVVTVNDLIREKQEPFGSRAKLKQRACNFADAIFCISNQTKQELIEMFSIEESKCHVAHLAPSEIFRVKSDDMVEISKKEDFILYVGNRSGYKNFSTLLQAFAKDKVLNSNFRLIVFGGEKKSRAEVALVKSLKIERKVFFLQGSDTDLLNLYKVASIMVYPSLDEGFGIPPLEAMASGCVTAVSRAGALPEILGENTRYFDPTSAESMGFTIAQTLGDTEIMKQLQSSGIAHAREYTWTKTAQTTASVYHRII